MADRTLAELLVEYDAAVQAAKSDPKAVELEAATAARLSLVQQETVAKEAAVSAAFKEQLRTANVAERLKSNELYSDVALKYEACRAAIYKELDAVKAEGVAEFGKLTDEELGAAISAARRTLNKLEAARSARAVAPEVKSETLGKLSRS